MTRKCLAFSMASSLLVLVGCDAGGEGGEAAADAARVEIVEPADGSTITGNEARVVLRTVGAEVAPADNRQTPGRGHHHLFLDEDLSSPGEPIPPTGGGIIHMGDASEEYTLTGLTPGEHRLIAWFAYGDHVPIEDVRADTVTFTVAAQ